MYETETKHYSKATAIILQRVCKSAVFPTLEDREQCGRVWHVLLLAIKLMRIRTSENPSTPLKDMS